MLNGTLPQLRERILPRLTAIFAFVFLCLTSSIASAQTVNQYTATNNGTSSDNIVDSPTCASVVTKTFIVGTSSLVSDVNIGVYLTHTYRSDLRITLRSPSSTSVSIMTNTGGSGDNLHDLFDDEASTAISGHNATATDSTATPPPYSHSFRPTAALSAFDGENPQGTWTLTICDSVNQDVGVFQRADLYITQPPTNFTDLSVSKSLPGGTYNTGDAVTYTVSVTNAASATRRRQRCDSAGLVTFGPEFHQHERVWQLCQRYRRLDGRGHTHWYHAHADNNGYRHRCSKHGHH